MASPVDKTADKADFNYYYTLLRVSRFLTTAVSSRTMRTLMKDLKCYNMKLKLNISE